MSEPFEIPAHWNEHGRECDGRVRIFRDPRRARYHAVCAATGERLTGEAGQGSRDQATSVADLKLRRAKQKVRPCLRCGATFLSDGPGHRMCDGCRGLSPGPFDAVSADTRFSEMRTIPR